MIRNSFLSLIKMSHKTTVTSFFLLALLSFAWGNVIPKFRQERSTLQSCPDGTYLWLGNCCSPTSTCPPGVPAGKVQFWGDRTLCLQALSNNTVTLNICSTTASGQSWTSEYVSNRLRLKLTGTNLCLTRGNEDGLSHTVSVCNYTQASDATQWFEYYGGLIQRYDSTWCLTRNGNLAVQKACDEFFSDANQFWVNEQYE